MSSKRKKSYLNAVPVKKRIMIQQIQKTQPFNTSSAMPLKKAKAPQQQQPIVNKRQYTNPVKFPTVVQSVPPKILTSIQYAYTQSSLHSGATPSAGTSRSLLPKLFKPIGAQIKMPNMNDHVVKQNLTQKARLKCKSPLPEHLVSHSNMFTASDYEEEQTTFRPLQHMNVSALLTESARSRLKRLFDKLDTDKDGHLTYSQVQRCLPSHFPRAQLTFLRVVYDILSGATYYGLQEFYAMAIIVEIIAKQDSVLWAQLLNDVDFNYYHDIILQLLEEFNEQCLLNSETIDSEQLLKMIMKKTNHQDSEHILTELEYFMPRIRKMKINRLDFIALTPTIIYIESNLHRGRSLFRFQENSLLDVHIRKALFT